MLKNLKLNLASYSLSSKLDIGKIQSIIEKRKIKRSGLLDYVYQENIKVATVHFKHKEYKSIEEYIGDCCDLIEESIKKGNHLILFPSFIGTLPLSIDKHSYKLVCDIMEGDNLMQIEQKAEFEKIMDRLGLFLFDAYYNIFLLLSHSYNVYLCCGEHYVTTTDGYFCRSFLFSPDSDEAYFQDKINLSEKEKALGIRAETNLKVFDLKVGRVCFLSGKDSDYFECVEVAQKKGVKIALCPCFDEGVSQTKAEYSGARVNTQRFDIFAVRANLCKTSGSGQTFTGASGLFAPMTLTKDLDGILAQTYRLPQNHQLLSHRLEIAQLTGCLDVYSSSVNSDFAKNSMEFYKST